jgi:ribosomal-protein-alanine N-acetyltransferase
MERPWGCGAENTAPVGSRKFEGRRDQRVKPEGQEPNPVRIRRADEHDMEALLTIERQCFNVYYYDYYMLDRRDFEFYLQDPDSLFLVAVHEAHAVGYILGPVDLWRDPPSAHIDSIAVLPEAQKKGIGTLLLQSFTSQVHRQGCTRVTLEVSVANEAGLAFFTRRGFYGIRGLPNYYGKNLDGLFMARDLQQARRL